MAEAINCNFGRTAIRAIAETLYVQKGGVIALPPIQWHSTYTYNSHESPTHTTITRGKRHNPAQNGIETH